MVQQLAPLQVDDADTGEIALVHELRSLEEIRALSSQLRVTVLRLLKEQERSVKEMCDILGESSTRLYYHVRQLEKAGLVRHVRTETRDGSVYKYYRSVAQFVTIPFDVLHDDPESPEAVAAVEVQSKSLERAAFDVRRALTRDVKNMTDDDYYVGRHFARMSPARARSYISRLNDLHMEFCNDDDEEGELRYTIAGALVPMGPARGEQDRVSQKGAAADEDS